MAVSWSLLAAAASLDVFFHIYIINKNIFKLLREHVNPTCATVTPSDSLSRILYAYISMIPFKDTKRKQHILLEQNHKKNSYVYGMNNLSTVLTKSR